MSGGKHRPGYDWARPAALIVDDDPVCRLFCCQALTSAGYQVLECSDPAEAIALSVRSHPRLILVDFRLAGARGCEVTANVLREWPDAGAESCIIGMTADHASQARADLLLAGCSEVLLKPFGVAELLAAITRGSGEFQNQPQLGNHENPLHNPGVCSSLEPRLQAAFLNELKRQLPVLDHAITTLDWSQAGQVLHHIIGAAALAGYASLSREARMLLHHVRQQDDGLALVEHYLGLLGQAADLFRPSPVEENAVLRQSQ